MTTEQKHSPMIKCNNAQMAADLADERGLPAYGMSVLDGKWYAGTDEQLKAIGVVDRDRVPPSALAKTEGK